MSRKSFTAEFKSKVAVEAIKGHRTISEIATEFGVHTSQINIVDPIVKTANSLI